MPSKKAIDIQVGNSVLHSGKFWVVREIKVSNGVVDLTTAEGGRISFFVNTIVKFY